MKAVIYTQKNDLDVFLYLSRFISELDKRGVKAIVHTGTAENLQFSANFKTFSNYEGLASHGVDFFFSFGGDGTIVSSLYYIQDLGIPVVGVNMGRLGFLASFTKENLFGYLDDILRGNTNISHRSVVEVHLPEEYDIFPYALNDVAISRRETTSMITVESYIDNEFLNVFWGDGVIVSTPTGSTAYSLSCGGPIIAPNNNNFVITPIAPHNLNVRPLIVNDDVEVKFRVQSRAKHFTLSLDSRLVHIPVETEFSVRKAQFHFALVHPNDLNFYETIRQKLLWGQDRREHKNS